MRFLLSFIFLAFVFTCAAQDDDMPDYRSKRDNLLKIPEKDIQAGVATFTMAGIDISNGKAPIASIPVKDFGNDFLTFDSGNLKVTIKAGDFTPAKHKLFYIEKYLVRIDGKAYYGSYGKLPKKNIQSISVIIGLDTVNIPPAAFADLYEPALTYAQGGEDKSLDGVYFTTDRQGASFKDVYIYMLCNDGRGGYEVTWVIRDKKYYRRILDFNILKN
jgi:hypothetical protein